MYTNCALQIGAYSYVVQGVGLTNGTLPVNHPTKFMSVDLFLTFKHGACQTVLGYFISLLSYKCFLHLVRQNGSFIVYKPCLHSL